MTVTAVTAALVYAALWVGHAREWAWLTAADRWFLEPAYDFGAGRPGWVNTWHVFCIVLGPDVLRALAAVLAIVLLRRRRMRPAAFLFACAALSWVATQSAKALADRPRPSTALVSAWSTSFPSGHALGVLVCVLALLTVLLPHVAERRRAWPVAAGAALIVAIGAGRVVLNVHHPSDVIAGWALGYLCFVACLPILRGGEAGRRWRTEGADPRHAGTRTSSGSRPAESRP